MSEDTENTAAQPGETEAPAAEAAAPAAATAPASVEDRVKALEAFIAKWEPRIRALVGES